jgi:RHS repeat-associated protein
VHTGQTSYTAKDQVDYQSLGGTTGGFLQQVDFTYLSNGFLEKINDPSGLGSDLFALGIGYDQAAANSNGVAQYNGNIASLESVSASGTHHVYGYEYDGLNRLKEADFYDNNDSGANDRYNSSYTYDALGNIQTLSRAGAKYDGQSVSYGTIDDLSYTYDASNNRNNRLLSVADNAPSGTKSAGYDPKSSSNFTYDDSGNMTYSPTGDYGIAYNFLNLPYEFDLIEDKILNTYAADETKLQELRVNDSGDTLMKRDYLGPAVYTNDSLTFVSHSNARIVPGECDLALNLSHTGQFSGQETYKAVTIQSTATMLDNSNISYKGESRISLGEGFMVESDAVFSAEVTPCPPVGSWVYQYYISDHLGNNRILFADLDGDGSVNTNEVLQENHYYAFGMEMEGDWQGTTSVPDQRYRYNGKELNEDLGLYDYGARWYDPAIGRWGQVDPSGEQYLSHSPYNYTLNNPIIYIDPDGRKVEYGDNVSKADKKAFKRRVKLLRKQSKTFKALWKDLKKSKHTHTISFTDTDSVTSTQMKDIDGYREGESRGTNILVNLNDSSVEGQEVGNDIAIGH